MSTDRRSAALQGDPSLQERMAVQRVEQGHQTEDLLERFAAEAGRRDFA